MDYTTYPGISPFTNTAQTMWYRLASFFPQLLSAIIVLILGWIFAVIVSGIVKRAIRFTRIDQLLQKTSLPQWFERNGISLKISDIAAWMVKWFFIIVTLIAVSDILNIPQITMFLEQVVLYIPQVLVAVALLTIGFIAGTFVETLVQRAVTISKLPTASAGMLASIAKWSIVIFSFLAALVQLGVAPSLVQIFFTGLVAMFSLAGGLAFGLGGRDKASQILERIDQGIKEENREVHQDIPQA